MEHQSYPGVVESLKISTKAKAERIARFAFDFAIKNNRKVSIIHTHRLIAFMNFREGRTCSGTLLTVSESHLCPQGQHHETR